MEYTAEKYLERIENKRLNSTPLYSREEMIDFAEKYAKQLTIHIVTNSCCDYPNYKDSKVQLNTETCQNCSVTRPKAI
jgi:hypothetical protein